MELMEKDTVLTLFLAALRSTAGDFLAVVWKTAAGELCAQYRFRYHGQESDPNNPFAGDRKSVYALGPVPYSEEQRQKLEAALRVIMSSTNFVDVQELAINGGPEKLTAALLKAKGWVTEIRRER